MEAGTECPFRYAPWPSTQCLSASEHTGAAFSLSGAKAILLVVLSSSRAFSLVFSVIQSRAQRAPSFPSSAG